MTGWLYIEERSAIAVARRAARKAATDAGFNASRVEEVAIVATEAATNALRHAGSGRFLIEAMPVGNSVRLAMIVADDGPGIANLNRMIRDGESGRGTAGLGLGAMHRLSDRFDLWTDAGQGTIVACEFAVSPETVHTAIADMAGLLVCHPAETLCGDGWASRTSATGIDVFLCDGLGHGSLAAEAADEMLAVFASRRCTPLDTLAEASRKLASHRGGVAAMIQLNAERGTLDYAGLGNISTLRIRGDEMKRLPVRDGQIGGPTRHAYGETLQLCPNDLFIIHSDGLKTLRLSEISPGLLYRSPLVIAGNLLHRHFAGRDDASVFVLRASGPQ